MQPAGQATLSKRRDLKSYDTIAGSTIRTLLHEEINPKDWQVLSLDDAGFLHFFFLGLFQVIMANPALELFCIRFFIFSKQITVDFGLVNYLS